MLWLVWFLFLCYFIVLPLVSVVWWSDLPYLRTLVSVVWWSDLPYLRTLLCCSSRTWDNIVMCSCTQSTFQRFQLLSVWAVSCLVYKSQAGKVSGAVREDSHNLIVEHERNLSALWQNSAFWKPPNKKILILKFQPPHPPLPPNKRIVPFPIQLLPYVFRPTFFFYLKLRPPWILWVNSTLLLACWPPGCQESP